MSEAPSTQGRQRCILVVEDDPTMTDMLRILLEDSGYRIVTAAEGQEALEIAHDVVPDLITLDIGLRGGMSGQEVVRRLRSHPATADVPVVVVTGMQYVPSPGERVDSVLSKPFDVAELEEVVRQLLRLGPGAGSIQS